MDIPVNAKISLLDEVKIQAGVLVPLIKALRAELGEQRANLFLTMALRDWSRRLYREIGEQVPGGPATRWSKVHASFLPRIEGDVDCEVLRNDQQAVEFNVTGCRYADFFRELGEPELGFLLLCEADSHIAELGSPEVEFKRSQTIMQGAKYCDFRYRIKKGAGPVSSFVPPQGPG